MKSLKVLNNRYQLLSIIKKGGFGLIYKGYDSVLEKDIAVKEIKPEFAKDSRLVSQFQSEARHVAKLNHQNIVHIFDLVQTDDNHFYIVMEYIHGLDLQKIIHESKIRGQHIPQHIAIQIIAEICKALDYAHNCGNSENNDPLNLVHQDVSPSNIMVSDSGIVKLIDFGIAGLRNKSITDDNHLSLQGKIPYMSPEHVSNDTQLELDKRSDIFSLGLVLFELLEGKRFFAKKSNEEIIDTLRIGKLKIKDFKRTPKPVQNIIQKALVKSPEKRYQNASQFYIDLVTYLVTNQDTSNIDKEIGAFISNLLHREAAVAKDDFIDLTDSKQLFEEVLDEIGEKEARRRPDSGASGQSQQEQKSGIAISETVETFTENANPAKFSAIQDDDQIEPSEIIEDEVKTVIDVVRLSTRGHKKLIRNGLIGLLCLLGLFFILDISFQWTSAGTYIFDYLFPPAIKISSVPSGAKIFLNNKPVDGVTPIAIDKINPGIYELKLTADGYAPIFKSLYIPSKGQIQIKGEPERGKNQPYIFRFKTTLEIDSMPQGAEVFINNIKYGKNTPCSLTWEVGEELQIELKSAGFNNIAGFGLDTENMIENIEDRRVWKFQIINEPTVRYKIQGLFGKFINIKSHPSKALIFLNGEPNPIGETGKLSKIFLTATSHNILLKKKGYNPKSLRLKVNKKTPPEVVANLSRPVRFAAYDATNGKTKDLEAIITKIVRNGKTVISNKRTPIVLNLLDEKYYAIFSKQGFKDTEVQISPKDRWVTARMESMKAQISVVILDTKTGSPLSNVEVRFKSLDHPNDDENLFNITDSDGTCSGYLFPGLYVFRTSKSAYKYQEKSVMIQSKGMNLVEFNLTSL